MELSTFTGVVAIIPAAGTGARMGAQCPKQYLKINEQTILEITLQKFIDFDRVELIVLVVSPEDKECYQVELANHTQVVIIEGGETRAHSVNNALKFLYDEGLPDEVPVMVHDVARPCVDEADLDKLVEFHQQEDEACLLVAPVVDTVHQTNKDSYISGLVDRNSFVKALTPQMAKFIDLKYSVKSALKDGHEVTDEASALFRAGYKVKTIKGRGDNIKITRPEDLILAERILSST
ncbi:MAG: 2-C-methyl-D-erythritol 4-phosphate cytidylyltransferase [Kangiellaceae bacterium]|nr:2-C-methyl-D-erythritol 4-phosphate cytidylyltransferase [Kangiellaceae bacterium]MCW8999107.1 2-C-methyl-D-erythritol 4-phosphate cytidylyltransferase [Kangiellaceae bacterium]MCW9015807.1 2-C-methyl-D-erythritol 4-phosphate cytidylyltransferase [Kangiellaceae bacterium]